MWSVPFNLGVHSSYLAVGMVYNEGRFAIVFLVNIIIVIVISIVYNEGRFVIIFLVINVMSSSSSLL